MDTESVIRNQVNVDALMDTLEILAKCLVSVFYQYFPMICCIILLRNILHVIRCVFGKIVFKTLFYLFYLIYKKRRAKRRMQY